MENSNDKFVQDFMQSVQVAPSNGSDDIKGLKRTITFLSIIIACLVATVGILGYTLFGYLSPDVDPVEDGDIYEPYIYNEDEALVSVEIFCVSSKYKYAFTHSNEYTLYSVDTNGNTDQELSSGTYSFSDDTHITLTPKVGAPKTLDFTKDTLTDAGEKYACQTY